MVYSIIITPYWSSFTEAYTTGDYEWITKSVNTIQKYWLLIPVGLIGMVYISDWFYYSWIGYRVSVPLKLSMVMALYVVLMTFNMIYVNFINGVGKIKLQVIVSIH
jgi:O-antigen/teichoic acid export membrane protein